MGTPISPPIDPDPVPAGDLCVKCWGIGKEFGDIDTPSSVIATIFGMEKASNWIAAYGEPLDGDYTLEQDIIYPCLFRFTDSPTGIHWSNESLYSTIFATNAEGYSCFSGGTDQCSLLILNTLDNRFTGGSCLITIPEIGE